MDSDELKQKAQKIFDTILQLETDKYDYEQRQLDQDYELKELAERQKLQQRNKAIKKGLDPESFTQKHPPTIHMFSPCGRRTDTRSYGDRKKLYEGGAEVLRAEWLESTWKEKFAEFSKRPAKKLPKWFGVRPGKKAGDPETPEGEEEAAAEEEAEEEYEEEEEEEDEAEVQRFHNLIHSTPESLLPYHDQSIPTDAESQIQHQDCQSGRTTINCIKHKGRICNILKGHLKLTQLPQNHVKDPQGPIHPYLLAPQEPP